MAGDKAPHIWHEWVIINVEMSRRPRNAWDAALEIIRRLRAQGHVALLAGGCVRDRLLGLAPKDFDVVTDAVPERVLEIFPRARNVGAKFGVVLVRRFGHDFEVATFRADGPYSDGRHPDSVKFGSDIEDARRRDFTINGLFLDPVDDRILDYVNGRPDIEAGIVQTIGDADQRFEEDHLRMLRAVRFAARLGFTIDPKTAESIRRHAHQLVTISAERVWMELEVILSEPARARGWQLLVDTGLRAHLSTAWPHSPAADLAIIARLDALQKQPVSPSLALSAALRALDKKTVAGVCRSLRLSNRSSKAVNWLIASLPVVGDEANLDLAGLKTLMAEQPWPELLELLRVDLVAAGEELTSYERLTARAETISDDCIAPPPLLDGDRLASLGVEPGPRMGEILDAVYREQLNERIETSEQAEAMARRLIDN